MEKDSEEKKNYGPAFIFWISVLFVCGMVVLSYWYVTCNFSDWGERGTFGDSYGALNALFSGLAFAGLIFTILLQRNELRLQRKELKQTREELERSANAQEATERALSNQVKAQVLAARIEAKSQLLNDVNMEISQYGPNAGSAMRKKKMGVLNKYKREINSLDKELNKITQNL